MNGLFLLEEKSRKKEINTTYNKKAVSRSSPNDEKRLTALFYNIPRVTLIQKRLVLRSCELSITTRDCMSLKLSVF